MPQIKRVALLVLAGLVVIVVLQNTETVQTRILFLTVSMPRAVLLVITTLVGFAIGVLVTFLLTKGQRR